MKTQSYRKHGCFWWVRCDWSKRSTHTWKSRFAFLIGWIKARTMFSLRLTQTESLSMYEIKSSLFLSTQKSTATIKNFLDLFWNLVSLKWNQQQKRWRCFAKNRVWMIRWKVCRKDWHLRGKRPQIGLCRKISNLYKVFSVFNVCFISYKTS